MSSSRTIIVTGAAGFIGAALVERLLKMNEVVIGIDNLNSYYSTSLKLKRLKLIDELVGESNLKKNWHFYKKDIKVMDEMKLIFRKFKPDIVIHLAAQAGVRYSLQHPSEYIDSNILGFFNILEMCRQYYVKHFVYASSSSVYGANKLLPFKETDPVNHPISLYAATKRSNELMAHSYSHLYNFSATGLRFFTVYGPWGRPDMAPMIFSKAIVRQEPIELFNGGKMKRDFTFIDDAVEAIVRCANKLASPEKEFDRYKPNPSTSFSAHRIFNVGNNKAVNLLYFLELLEKMLGKKAIIKKLEMQPGDVQETLCDNSNLANWIGFSPDTSIEKGIGIFAKWYQQYSES